MTSTKIKDSNKYMISKFNAKNELILGWFKYMNIKNLIIIS
jgi:hypothetical protein